MTSQKWKTGVKGIVILNQGKTTLLHFYNRKEPDFSSRLVIRGSTIPTSTSVKYLGIKITSNLSLYAHIHCVAKRLIVVCCLVQTLKNIVDKEVLLKIYHGCFHSVMSYMIGFWGNSRSFFRIFLFPNRIIRNICKENFICHCMPQKNILTLTHQPSYWRYQLK